MRIQILYRQRSIYSMRGRYPAQSRLSRCEVDLYAHSQGERDRDRDRDRERRGETLCMAQDRRVGCPACQMTAEQIIIVTIAPHGLPLALRTAREESERQLQTETATATETDRDSDSDSDSDRDRQRQRQRQRRRQRDTERFVPLARARRCPSGAGSPE